jgi:hypothetical protein
LRIITEFLAASADYVVHEGIAAREVLSANGSSCRREGPQGTERHQIVSLIRDFVAEDSARTEFEARKEESDFAGWRETSSVVALLRGSTV